MFHYHHSQQHAYYNPYFSLLNITICDEHKTPESIHHHLLIITLKAVVQVGKYFTDLTEISGNFVTSSAQIRKQPYCVALEQRGRTILVLPIKRRKEEIYILHNGKKSFNHSAIRNTITISVVISSNVSQSPYNLLFNSHFTGVNKTNQLRKSSRINDCRSLKSLRTYHKPYLLFRSRSNIGQYPSSFILKLWNVVIREEICETRNKTSVNDQFNWGSMVY